MNLSLLLDMAADGLADRTVVGAGDRRYSGPELQALSRGAASRLTEAGATALLFLDVNGPAFPVALFAAAYAGVPLVPLNYRLDADRLAGMIARHPGAVAVCAPEQRPLFSAAQVESTATEEWLNAARAATPVETAVETESPAVIIYTSGTTSEPKGVVLRHENLVSYVLDSVEFASAGADDAALVSVPPYHIAAVANAITNLYAGRRTIVLENFTGEQWLNLVRTERVTNALVVPTMLARIIDSAGDTSAPSLRTLAYGGASMPIRVIRQALTMWPHVDFVNAYGLTETSSTIAVLGPDDHRAAVSSADPQVQARLGSAGRAVPAVEIEIRDSEGKPAPVRQRGRIWVRGAQVSGEYVGIGSTVDPDGYFDTRDEGFLDEDGYLFIGGRTDDTIIRGGENIAPAQIEEALLARSGVVDAVVIGVEDEEWGQRIEAVVVAAPGVVLDLDAIRSSVRDQLRSALTPDRIWVWDEVPRSETGKVVRRDVARRITELIEADRV